jgi:hypothetical protein
MAEPAWATPPAGIAVGVAPDQPRTSPRPAEPSTTPGRVAPGSNVPEPPPTGPAFTDVQTGQRGASRRSRSMSPPWAVKRGSIRRGSEHPFPRFLTRVLPPAPPQLHPSQAHSYADDLSQDVSNSPDQQVPVDRDGAVHDGDHCSQLTNPSLQPAHQFRGAPVHLVGAPFDIGEHVDDPGQVLEGNHGGRPKVIDPDMATSSPVLCVTRAHPSPRSHRS